MLLLLGHYKIGGRIKPEWLNYLGVTFYVVILIFRFDVGWDYPNYYQFVYPTLDTVGTERLEPLSRGICRITAYSGYPFLLFIIYGGLTCLLVFKTLIKYTNNLLLAYLTYNAFFFDTAFGTIRQGLALGVILYGYRYLKTSQWPQYCLCCIVAALIHSSSLICLLFPILYKFLTSTWRVLFLAIPLILILHFELGNILERFSMYESYINGEIELEGGSLIRYAYILFAISLYLVAIHSSAHDEVKRLIRISLLGCVIPFVLEGPIGTRLTYYFLVYLCIALPNTVGACRKPMRTTWGMGLVLFFMANLYISSTNIQKSPYIPYQTIFFVDPKKTIFK